MRTLLLTLACFALFSCDKVDELTRFTISDDTEITVKAGVATLLPFDITTPPITSNAETELTMRNGNMDMIESLKMEEMRLNILSPQNRTFDFLKDMEMFIAADGLPERRIAFVFDVPETVTNVLRLTVEDLELEEYIKKGKYTIRVKITTDKVINEDIKVRIQSKYRVDAKILGV